MREDMEEKIKYMCRKRKEIKVRMFKVKIETKRDGRRDRTNVGYVMGI